MDCDAIHDILVSRSVMLILVIWKPEKFSKYARKRHDGFHVTAWTVSLYPLLRIRFLRTVR